MLEGTWSRYPQPRVHAAGLSTQFRIVTRSFVGISYFHFTVPAGVCTLRNNQKCLAATNGGEWVGGNFQLIQSAAWNLSSFESGTMYLS